MDNNNTQQPVDEIKNLRDAITRARWELQGAMEQACCLKEQAEQAGDAEGAAELDVVLAALDKMQDAGKDAAKAAEAL